MKLLNTLFTTINSKITQKHKLKDLKYLIKDYNGTDWKKYTFFLNNTYNRNIIYRNHQIELIIISWNNNQISGIHDHPKNGCLMKILDGELDEYVYKRENNNLNLINIKNLKKGNIGYQENINGIHNIINKNNKTVSLHIYSPPNYKSTRY